MRHATTSPRHADQSIDCRFRPQRAVITSQPAELLTRTDCPPGVLLLHSYLKNVADQDGLVEKHSRETIAAKLNVTPRTVTSWICHGARLGLWRIVGGGVQGLTLIYQLATAPLEQIKRLHRMAMARLRKQAEQRERHKAARQSRWKQTSTHPSFPREGGAPPPPLAGGADPQPTQEQPRTPPPAAWMEMRKRLAEVSYRLERRTA